MAGTTVYAAKVALKAMLEAHTWGDPAPTIQWGAPTENEDQPFDVIYFGSVEITDQHRILGRTHADEQYRLPVIVDVQRYGDDEQATEQRMWELHDHVITVLRTDPTLTGTIRSLDDYTVRQGNVPGPQQWRSQIVIDVGCTGQITYL